MAPLTFEEILQYHPQNEQILKRLKMQLPHLIPFVGAGLSAFAYPQWAEALKEMAGWVTDTPCQKQVLQLAKQEPLDAAQRLEELLGKTRLVQCMQKVFSSEKLKAHAADLPGEAVYLLPLLFPQSPVITTNFDRILERVYGDLGHPFAHTVLPGRQELLHQMRQEYGHGLFKLHGDVDETMVESGSIVWTREQYNNAYNPEGDLWKELKAWFQNRSVLFLGCSLKDDRTMALLQEVMEPGLTHFAIVGCARKERDSRLRELSETFHIQAIVYPKGRHEAVRIILEKLLEETNPPAYQSLTRPLSMLSAPPSSRFAYNAKYIPFTGREQERRQLQAFFHSSEPLKWWAVTGPGGAGKSRLVFEAAEELKGQGWTVQYLKSSSYRTLEKLPLHAGRGALLVADYAQAYVGVIGRWLEELEGQRRSTPLRVLLIERDGQSCEESSWGSQLQGAMQRSRIAKALCYREPFLALQPLQEAELQTILQNYIEAWGKAWKPEEIQSLLQALQTVDPELQRPLYALFVADAWVQGKDPTQWDRKQILQYVLDREQDYTNSKICQLAGGQNQRLRLAVRQIQAVATICGELSLEELQNGYPRLWDSLCQETQKLGSVISEQDFARQAGLLQADGNLAAVRPDLVGEYFVFRHVIEAQTWPLLFPTGWETQLERLTFLYRLIRDYPEELAGQEFNPNSPAHLSEILFNKLGLPTGKKTKTGYSTDVEVLEKLLPYHPIVGKILEYRKLSKLSSTYVTGLKKCIQPDGRVRSTFNQTETRTGRISSTEPNLQNIPMRMELGRLIRKAFVPKEGYLFTDADYSQIELRVLAHMSGDEQLIEAYRMDADIHRITASRVFHTPFEEVTDLQRRNAKAVNFGIVYGISSFGLSQDLSISRKEASEYIEEYFKTYPGVKAFLDREVASAKEKGYSVTLFERRRPVPELKSSNFMQRSFGERVAMNAPIQGTAADIIKIAMIRVSSRLAREGLQGKLILQVHDELIVECPPEEREQVERILQEEMEGAVRLSVPMVAEAGSGRTWFEAKE